MTKTAITPEQCRMGRSALDWSQQELAKHARVARKTVADFELHATTPYARTLKDVIDVMTKAGVIFIDPVDGRGPGVSMTEELAVTNELKSTRPAENVVKLVIKNRRR
jgi:predicted transcriptional regulator